MTVKVTKLACIFLSGVALAAAQGQMQQLGQGQQANIQGVISSRNGPNMTIQESDGTSVTAVLNDYTQVKMKEGGLGFRKKEVNVTVLLPGLRLQVSGVGNANGQLVAEKITLTKADLQAAREIEAGNAPIEAQQQQLSAQQQQLTAEQQSLQQQQQALAQKEQQDKAAAEQAQQSANMANQRISDLNKYTTKYQTDVYFGNDQISLSPDAKQKLSSLATQALATNAYMVQISAFASATGSAQLNEELSNERADAVIAYLTKFGHIPLYRILSPAAMGASTAAGSDPALNRRVSVKVVVNQGISE